MIKKSSTLYNSSVIALLSGCIWWIVLFFIGFKANTFIPFSVTFANYSLQNASNLPIWILRWINFDGGAYLTVADIGYTEMGLIQAYFPGFPLMLRWVADNVFLLTGKTGISALDSRILVGLTVNFICSLLFFYLLDQYLRLGNRFDDKTRLYIFLSFLLFPTSFFLHAVYNEALFLILLVCSLYAYQKKWWLRLLLALIWLTATRVVGIFLIPALIIDLYCTENTKNYLKAKTFLSFAKRYYAICFLIALGSIGLISYMTYLYVIFKDPLLFFHLQSSFGAGRQQSLILFPQVVWRYLKIFWIARPFDLKYFAYLQEFTLTMFALVVLLFATVKRNSLKIFTAELWFSAGAFFLPTLTGNFSSMGRYVLVCLPIFFVLGQFISHHKIARMLYISLCVLLSLLNIILFIQGHWVA